MASEVSQIKVEKREEVRNEEDTVESGSSEEVCLSAWRHTGSHSDQDESSGLSSERCPVAREDLDTGSTRGTPEALRKEQHVQDGPQGASLGVSPPTEDSAADGTELQDSSGNKKKSLVVNRIQASAVSIFVTMKVEETTIRAAIDCGAEVSILSSRVYNTWKKKPQIYEPDMKLVVANEEKKQLAAEGVAFLEISIGNAKFQWPVYVAHISEDFLLGADIFDNQKMTLSAENGLKVKNEWIPCEFVRRVVHTRRIQLKNDRTIDIPPAHEVVVRVPYSGAEKWPAAIVEPVIEDDRGIRVARTLVDLRSESVPVRILNLTAEPQRLKKGYILGEMSPAEEVEDVKIAQIRGVNAEPSEEGAVQDTPRLEEEDSVSEFTPLEEEYLEQEAQELPEHVRELYVRTAMTIAEVAGRKRLKEVLTDRQEAFARNKLDFGCFKGLKHEINTGCAAPIRDRVRPTPEGSKEKKKGVSTTC